MRYTEVSSTSNPKFRLLQDLRNARSRKKSGLTAVEGQKEIEMLVEAGWQIQIFFFVKEFSDENLLKVIADKYPQAEIICLDEKLFAKVTYRDSTGGMIAVVKTKYLRLSDIKLSESPLVLIVDGVEKPGNLGAILRTADAAAIDAVICCNLPSDIYNPNVIRASLGTVFTVQLVEDENETIMDWLKKREFTTFCSNLHQAVDYFEQDYTGPSAIVVGTEATGVSDAWIDFADTNVKIPMLGLIDSMNVSVASAVMLYEARRQRMKKKLK